MSYRRNFKKDSANFSSKYQVPPKSPELIEKENRINYLVHLYDKYLDTYYDFFKSSILNELDLINEHFPNVSYFTEHRIKSRKSYEHKVEDKVNQGKTGTIYDVFASKLVVESYYDRQGNLVTDENLLTAKALEISRFLETQRELSTENGVCKTETDQSKNYIEHPKESGYRSYHILRHFTFSDDVDFHTEIQVKTRKMYDEEQYGKKCGHATVYKNNRDGNLKNSDCIKDEVPIFLKLYWNKTKLRDDLTPLPFKQCFEKFFGKKYKDYRMQIEAQNQASNSSETPESHEQ